MHRSSAALAAILAGCGVSNGDVVLVVLPSSDADLRVDAATAAIHRLEFEACDGELDRAEIGYRMDLLAPDPLPAPIGTYCAVNLIFARDEDQLVVSGDADGSLFDLVLEPVEARVEGNVSVNELTDGVLVFDLDLLLTPADVADLAAGTPDVADLSMTSRDAWAWYTSDQEAAFTIGTRWNLDIDVDIDARAHVQGCGSTDPLYYDPKGPIAAEPLPGWQPESLPPDSETGGDSDSDSGGDSPPPPDRGGCDGGGSSSSCTSSSPSYSCDDPTAGCADGCSGSDSSCSGSDCGSTSTECATGNLAPVGWAVFTTFIALRRRPTRPPDPPQAADAP
jgi:hypothetical protein